MLPFICPMRRWNARYVCARLLAFAAGGFFDGTTSADQRRQFLINLLKDDTICASSPGNAPTSDSEVWLNGSLPGLDRSSSAACFCKDACRTCFMHIVVVAHGACSWSPSSQAIACSSSSCRAPRTVHQMMCPPSMRRSVAHRMCPPVSRPPSTTNLPCMGTAKASHVVTASELSSAEPFGHRRGGGAPDQRRQGALLRCCS